jgi:CubicO group peptidase (beta-lactamase class C family)
LTAIVLAAALALPAVQRARIDTVVAEVMREKHIAGLSLGIARRGTLLYLRGYGYREVERRLRADGFTVYRVGSVSKQFTAALVLQTAEEGHILLTSSIRAYLPQLDLGMQTVTVEHLLKQTSAVSGDWHYSNANYTLLGSMLETVAGRRFPDLLRERITQPLALPSTGCDFAPFAINVARGYEWHGAWTQPEPDAALPCSSVGLAANAADLIRWLEALRSGRVVSAASFKAMTSSARLPGGIPTNYGDGFFIANWFGYAVAEHSGNVAGYSAEDALVLRDGLEVAVLSNAGTVDLTPLAKSLVAALDPPLDRNLAAIVGAPPQNENLRITSGLNALLQTSGFASYGTLESLEFVERTNSGGTTDDKYRVTFSAGQWWANVGYRSDDAIVSLSLSPVE